jgi:hypothetical protein
MDRLLKKLQCLLPLLLGAFVMTACAVGNKPETAVPPTAAPMEPSASQEPTKSENQDPANISENNPALPGLPATVQPPEDNPTPTAASVLAPLPVIAPAPSWHNDTWINSDAPLPLEDLRGKVVLLEFWTFG